MIFTKEFNTIGKAQNERIRQQDRDDLNHELAGVDVGRIKRFLSPESRDIVDGERKSEKALSALELLLLSADYAQAFEATEQAIREAQQKAGKFLDKVDQAIEKLQQEIDETLEQAVTLPNGKKAFMNAHGEVFTEDGERVDQAIVDGFDWTDKPSLELRDDQLRRMDQMRELDVEGTDLSLRLGEIDNALHDEDNPPDRDEVDALSDEVDGISSELNVLDKKLDSLLTPNGPKPHVGNDLGVVKHDSIVPAL